MIPNNTCAYCGCELPMYRWERVRSAESMFRVYYATGYEPKKEGRLLVCKNHESVGAAFVEMLCHVSFVGNSFAGDE